MDEKTRARVNSIRAFNRFYTNFIGLLNFKFLDSAFSLSEARILLEIDSISGCTASRLISLLEIDPGYLSRIINRFEHEGLIAKRKSVEDGRVYYLSLTGKGSQALENLIGKSDREIYEKVKDLSEIEQTHLISYMTQIEQSLNNASKKQPLIREYRPGDLGYMDYMHCKLYEREYGLDSSAFELYVLPGMAKFLESPDKRGSNIWVAEFQGQIIGSIAIIRADNNSAQLRWFLIEPEYRGLGLGGKLITTATDFCIANGYKRIFLWTIDILHNARYLYKKSGFELVETKSHFLWGKFLTEEQWELKLTPD